MFKKKKSLHTNSGDWTNMQKQVTQPNTYRITHLYTKVYMKELDHLRNVQRVGKVGQKVLLEWLE